VSSVFGLSRVSSLVLFSTSLMQLEIVLDAFRLIILTFFNVRFVLSSGSFSVEVQLTGHRFDPDTPVSETMHALHDVVKAGYVRYLGMSSCHAYQCMFSFAHSKN
jgi:diketogulonate reductase-like aldo/keto reductase